MLNWIFGNKENEFQALAQSLEKENDRLRRENAVLANLVRALRDVNEHLDKRLQYETTT
jgi:uncharacterized protein YaaN involved in tellurite resistance